jgi:hypothetical protein
MLVVHNNQHPEPLFKLQLMVSRVPPHVQTYKKSLVSIATKWDK